MTGRRAFVAGVLAVLGTAMAASGVNAQLAPGTHRIGWLSPAAAATGAPNLDALRQGSLGLTIPTSLLVRADHVIE